MCSKQHHLVVVCFICSIISVAELKVRGSCSCQTLPLFIHVSARMSEEESACGRKQSFVGLEPKRRAVLASFRYQRHSRCRGQNYQGAPFARWDQEFEAREDRVFHHGARDVRVFAAYGEIRHSICRCVINSSHRHKCVPCNICSHNVWGLFGEWSLDDVVVNMWKILLLYFTAAVVS